MKNDSQLSAFALRDKPAHIRVPRVSVGWNDERVAALRRLQMEGLSTSQIAASLGGITRNAVIGKLHRLGYTGPRSGIPTGGKPHFKKQRKRSSHSGYSEHAIKRRKPMVLRPMAFRGPPRDPSILPLPHADDVARISYASFVDPLAEVAIPKTACRWPVGEPMTGFCGCTAAPGSSYCAGHLARSVVNVQVTPRPYQTTALSVRSIKDVEGFLS